MIENILKFTDNAVKNASNIKFLTLNRPTDSKKKYKVIVKKDKYKTSLYKKLSPKILGVVI